jgi:hypothetical protein
MDISRILDEEVIGLLRLGGATEEGWRYLSKVGFHPARRAISLRLIRLGELKGSNASL